MKFLSRIIKQVSIAIDLLLRFIDSKQTYVRHYLKLSRLDLIVKFSYALFKTVTILRYLKIPSAGLVDCVNTTDNPT
jgi:hypothetical protein